MARFSAPTTERRANLAHDARFASGPAPIHCAGCDDAIAAGHHVDFKPYCGDCLDRDVWLANAREHSRQVREAARG